MVREHRRRQIEERFAYGPGYSDLGLVFAREDGSEIDPDGVTDAFARHVIRAGLPIIRLHDLRHTHATLALAAGIHPNVVQQRLGHARPDITLSVYSHVLPGLQASAASRIADLVEVNAFRALSEEAAETH